MTLSQSASTEDKATQLLDLAAVLSHLATAEACPRNGEDLPKSRGLLQALVVLRQG